MYFKTYSWTLPEFASMPTKRWLQIEVCDEIVIDFLLSFHIQPRFRAVVYAKLRKCQFLSNTKSKAERSIIHVVFSMYHYFYIVRSTILNVKWCHILFSIVLMLNNIESNVQSVWDWLGVKFYAWWNCSFRFKYLLFTYLETSLLFSFKMIASLWKRLSLGL